MSTIVKKPVEDGSFKKLAGNLYNQLLENRVFQDRKFTLKSLATQDFGKIMDTVITDREMFGKMKKTLVQHVKHAVLPQAKPFLKLGIGTLTTFIGGAGTTWGGILATSLAGFVDYAVDLFTDDPVYMEFNPGDYFAIDIVKKKTKNVKLSSSDEKQYTLGFFVDYDTTRNKLFLFIYEFGKVMSVERKFARKLGDSETRKFEENDQIQFVKELFLLRYYDPVMLQTPQKQFEEGLEVDYKGQVVYVVNSEGGRVLVEDKVGDRFEVNSQDLKVLRSNRNGNFARGDWVVIPSELSSRIPRVLACVSYFIGNDAITYETATGKQRRVNKFDLSHVSDDFKRLFTGNNYFIKFKVSAMKSEVSIVTKKIPSKYYNICFLQGADIDYTSTRGKIQPYVEKVRKEEPVYKSETRQEPVAYNQEPEEAPPQQRSQEGGGGGMIVVAAGLMILLSTLD